MTNSAQPQNGKTFLAQACTKFRQVASVLARKAALLLLVLGAGVALAQPCVAQTAVGHGTIDGVDGPATFQFSVTNISGQTSGIFSYDDPAAGLSLRSIGFGQSVFFPPTAGEFVGMARAGHGRVVTFKVNVFVAGTSQFFIDVKNGYSAGGFVTSGEIRIE